MRSLLYLQQVEKKNVIRNNSLVVGATAGNEGGGGRRAIQRFCKTTGSITVLSWLVGLFCVCLEVK